MKKKKSSNFLFVVALFLCFLMLVSCDNPADGGSDDPPTPPKPGMTVIGLIDVAGGHSIPLGPFDALIDVDFLSISPTTDAGNLKVYIKKLSDFGVYLDMESTGVLDIPAEGNWVARNDESGNLMSYWSLDFSKASSVDVVEFTLPDLNTLSMSKEKVMVGSTLEDGTNPMGVAFSYIGVDGNEYLYKIYREDGMMKLAFYHKAGGARSVYSGAYTSSIISDEAMESFARDPDVIIF